MFGGNNSGYIFFVITSLKLVNLFQLLLELYFVTRGTPGQSNGQYRTKSEMAHSWCPDPTESAQIRQKIKIQLNPDLRSKKHCYFYLKQGYVGWSSLF
jgi:hypothetical protein